MTGAPLYLKWYDRARSGIPVLFLHGFMGSASDWNAIAPRLEARTLGMDLPGHGFSDGLRMEGPWFEATIQRIHDTLVQERILVVNIVGYSLGGRIALHFAQKYPDMVHRLVLESCHPGLRSESEKSNRRSHDGRWAAAFLSKWPGVIEDWYEQDVFKSFSGNRALMKAEKLGNDP